MKKTSKKILIFVIVVFLLWMVLFTTDFLRLKDSTEVTAKPLITCSIEQYNDRKVYDSIGYSVAYYINDDTKSTYGLEIRIFGIIIWAWTE